MKKIFVIFSLCLISVNAQDFKLGFDIEAHQVRYSSQDGNHILGGDGIPLAIHFNVSYITSPKVLVLIKAGRTLHEEFKGWEYGFRGKYNLFTPFFIFGGVIQHSNEGGRSSNSGGTNYTSILMLHAGLGIDLSSITSLEVSYYIPTSNENIGWYGSGGNEIKDYSRIFENMIRLGFVFGWDI